MIQDDVKQLALEFEQFSRKNVLVTGGAGFIGSWLCDVLLRAGAVVDCIDNLSTGKLENIRDIKGEINFIEGNIENVEFARKYHYIFHLSSRASPEEYQQHPIETLTTNSLGALRVLDHARKSGAVLLLASTSEAYGDAQIVPTPETYYGYVNPVGLRSCYDEGKRFAEALCMAFFRQHRVRVRIARIFNTYGPRIREDGLYGRALPRFVAQALKGDPITIYGDGSQTRSFCHVTDTVRGLINFATAPGLDGEVINIGNPHEITILELVRLILVKTKSKSKLSYFPYPPDDPKRRCPDISRARSLLNWSPRVNLNAGLAETIDWFRGNANL